MNYLITLDLGTTSVKTTLYDCRLSSIESNTEEYSLLTPGPDVVELEPRIYWAACVNGIQKVLKRSGIDAAAVISISISTQGETFIPVDPDGTPLSNAIVWLDARANEEAAWLKERIGDEEYFRVTGLPEFGSANPISKLLWVKNNKPDIYEKTYKFLLLEDFIIYKLSGVFVTEPTNMSSSGYFNTRDNIVWTEGLEKAGLDPEKIPSVIDSGAIVGNILEEAAAETGLSPGTVIIAGANDQICSAVGTGNIAPSTISETTGTALVVVCTTDKMPDTNEYNVTVSRHCNGTFIILAYSATSGIIYKWFKDVFCEDDVLLSEKEGLDIYDHLNTMAEKVPRGSDGLLLLPYFAGKLSPDLNEDACGTFYGVGLRHTKGHFIRAIMEGIACMLRENLEIAHKLCGESNKVISTGGGSKSPLWNQIKADMINKELCIATGDGSSLGAAIIGAVSNGWFGSIDEACKSVVKISGSYQPDSEGVLEYQKLYDKYLLLYDSLMPVFRCK